MSISRVINLNDLYPPAPEGKINAKWQSDEHDPKNVSAYVDAKGVIVAIFDGGESSPPAGKKCFLPYVPYNAMIKRARMIADQAGNAVITVKKSSYADFPTTVSIVASAAPTLSTAQKSEDSTLTGWTLGLTEGDVLEFVVTSAATLKWLGLALKIERT